MLGGALLTLAAASATLHPVDQCSSDATFVQFRAGLRDTIARRDTEALLRVVADDVYASFGGYIGKSDFIELWRLAEKPKESGVWEELGQIFKFGCAVDGKARVVPSFEMQVDEKRDPFDTWIALPGAVLRQSPSNKGRVIAHLRWHVLTLDRALEGETWLLVRLDDGRTGYIRTDATRSVLDYRAAFEKRDGRWLMTSFVAGD